MHCLPQIIPILYEPISNHSDNDSIDSDSDQYVISDYEDSCEDNIGIV